MSFSILVALIVGTVIPGVTALITKREASPKLKSFTTAALAAVSGAVTAIATTTPANTAQWEAIVGTMLAAWVSAAATSFAGWEPTGAAAYLSTKTARFGIGPSTP